MENQTVLEINNIYKKFCRSLRRSMAYGALDVTRSMFGFSYDCAVLRKKEFWALEDICFNLQRGETVGLIGVNGSGKSTLLRMINGIYPPDKGRITIQGKIGALIALGAGFHPQMTGRENIYLNGTILGMSKKEINKKFDSIVDFAEIDEFLDAPVSTYSSGMFVRLGFSIAIHSEIDILLVDEVLAVGDTGFQLKCFNKIGELKKNGVATLLVSHNMHTISTFSNKVLLINKGKQEFYGEVSEGLSLYKKYFNEIFESEGEIEKVITGNDKMIIESIHFNPILNKTGLNIKTKEQIEIQVNYEASTDLDDIEIDLAFRLPIPYEISFFQATNHTFGKKIDIRKGKGTIKIFIKDIFLNDFRGYLSFALWERERTQLILWWKSIPVYIEGNSLSTGWGSLNLDYDLILQEK